MVSVLGNKIVMKAVNVFEKIGGSKSITQQDGQKIYDLISEPLQNGEEVVLDFLGINQFASPFFNHCIGQLLKEVDLNTIEQKLKIENIDDECRELIELILRNASIYYHGNANKDIIERIVEKNLTAN